jgi:hypothetical protein
VGPKRRDANGGAQHDDSTRDHDLDVRDHDGAGTHVHHVSVDDDDDEGD